MKRFISHQRNFKHQKASEDTIFDQNIESPRYPMKTFHKLIPKIAFLQCFEEVGLKEKNKLIIKLPIND